MESFNEEGRKQNLRKTPLFLEFPVHSSLSLTIIKKETAMSGIILSNYVIVKKINTFTPRRFYAVKISPGKENRSFL
jgi:hypothetical protein